MLRSDNAGATWTVVGTNRWGQAGPKGNLPWASNVDGTGHTTILAPTDRTVLALGTSYAPPYHRGVFCSRDAGRTWRTTCA